MRSAARALDSFLTASSLFEAAFTETWVSSLRVWKTWLAVNFERGWPLDTEPDEGGMVCVCEKESLRFEMEALIRALTDSDIPAPA